MALLKRKRFLVRKRKIVIFIVTLVFTTIYIVQFNATKIVNMLSLIHIEEEPLEETLEQILVEEKGTGCVMPKLNPFDKEIMQYELDVPDITCMKEDWINCYFSKCKIKPEILELVGNVQCTFRDILHLSDSKYIIGPPVLINGEQDYLLNKSDHVKINCSLSPTLANAFENVASTTWDGHGVGFRPVKPENPSPGRENTLNVLILGFDTVSKCMVIRNLPQTYKFIKEELDAEILNGYNVLGDGTPAALFPILTGKTEDELPECRKSIPNSGHLDDLPFIFYKLKKDGYRTAFFEDMPWLGTFQYRFNGFRHQPADHYLRSFYLEESKISGRKDPPATMAQFCVDGTPRFKLMMNITEQFLKLDGKRFVFTFISDITHGLLNVLTKADETTMEFLKRLKQDGRLKDTLLILMSDHGPRFSKYRSTLQGRLEERLPFMAIRLPEELTAKRPDAAAHLKHNVDALTTPHDIYATVLDVLDMREHWNDFKVKGADLTRGMTLLEPIPKNRSCSEAGIYPHWCACIKWETVKSDDPFYKLIGQTLVDFINKITASQREKCAVRTLKSVVWVTKMYQGSKKWYLETSGMRASKRVYQVKIEVGPGVGVYEATIAFHTETNQFKVNTKEISRTNPYNDEPKCLQDKYPRLNQYCYCIS